MYTAIVAQPRRAPRTVRLSLVAAIVGGCTVDSEDGATSLADPTYAATTATTASTTAATTMTTGGSASSTSDGEDSSSGGGSGDATSGAPGSSEGDAETGGGTGQPSDGPYSPCETAAMCFGLTACVVPMPGLGFCSEQCMIPGDCGPSPGGSAQPACVMATVNAVAMQVCALDCSGGKTCPTGMECVSLESSMVCA